MQLPVESLYHGSNKYIQEFFCIRLIVVTDYSQVLVAVSLPLAPEMLF